MFTVPPRLRVELVDGGVFFVVFFSFSVPAAKITQDCFFFFLVVTF